MTTLIGYQNHLDTAVVTATSSPVEHPVTDGFDYLTTDYWAPGTGTNDMLIDLGATKDVNYLGIVGEGVDSAELAHLNGQPPTTWTLRDSTFGTEWINSVVWDGAQFVAVGSGRVAVSTDAGTTWSGVQVNATLTSIAFGAGVYIAGALGNGIYRSTDAVNWSIQTSPFSVASVFCVTWANGMFFVANGDGEIGTSPDGSTWTIRKARNNQPITDLSYGNGRFVAIGGVGDVWTSDDGLSWQQREWWNAELVRVAFDGGMFLCGGLDINGGVLYSSTDGITWTQLTAPPVMGHEIDIIHIDGYWVIGGSNSQIATSPNGNVWTLSDVGFGGNVITALAYNGDTLVAAGSYGKLATSSVTPAWTTLWSANPADKSVIMASFHTANAQNWRLRITGSAPKIAHVSLGQRLEIPTPLGTPFVSPKQARKDRVINAVTQGGEFTGRSIIRSGYEFDMDFKLIETTWVDENFDDFLAHIATKPFFVLWDSLNHPDEAAFAWLRNAEKLPAPRWSQSAYQDLSLDLEGKV